jgi:HD-GYP domain-containing protein (c-di-GMP phosphodiesterase class II)
MGQGRKVNRIARSFSISYVVVVAAGAAVTAASLASPGAAWHAVIIWALLVAAVDLYPVSLPRGGYVSVAPAFDYAAIVAFGPAAAALIELLAQLIIRGAVRRTPLYRTVFNAALFPVAVYAAGNAYLLAGGRVGAFDLPASIVPLFVCGAVYFGVNSAALSFIVGLAEGVSAWRVWRLNSSWAVLHLTVMLSLGGLMALVYIGAGTWGLFLFCVPLVFARHAFRLYVQTRRELYEFVKAMSDIIEEVDTYTKEHSQRVAEYAVSLARAMNVPEKEVQSLEYAALVHDLGKVAWPTREAVKKSGELSREERREMLGHPRTAANIMIRVKALRDASKIVRYHHERPDGKGYPLGLPGDEVPLSALILNVADAFDAMTSDRPYRQALTDKEALSELNKGSGTQFDDRVVRCLVDLYERGKLGVGASRSVSLEWAHLGW